MTTESNGEVGSERVQRAMREHAGRENVRSSVMQQRPSAAAPPSGANDLTGPLAELAIIVAEQHAELRQLRGALDQARVDRVEIEKLRAELDALATSPPDEDPAKAGPGLTVSR